MSKTIEVEVTVDEFADLPQDRKDKVLFSAVLGIDKKLTEKIKDHEERLDGLEEDKGCSARKAAFSGLVGGMVAHGLYLFGKITMFKIDGG